MGTSSRIIIIIKIRISKLSVALALLPPRSLWWGTAGQTSSFLASSRYNSIFNQNQAKIETPPVSNPTLPALPPLRLGKPTLTLARRRPAPVAKVGFVNLLVSYSPDGFSPQCSFQGGSIYIPIPGMINLFFPGLVNWPSISLVFASWLLPLRATPSRQRSNFSSKKIFKFEFTLFCLSLQILKPL